MKPLIQQSLNFWASILSLDSFVDTITFRIIDAPKKSDPEEEHLYSACVVMDTTTRTAEIVLKNNIVEVYKDEYTFVKEPEDVVDMAILHECIHIVAHPMSSWASTTIDNIEGKEVLAKLFEQEEEQTVEHLTRVFYSFRDCFGPYRFKGKVVYVPSKRKNIKDKN